MSGDCYGCITCQFELWCWVNDTHHPFMKSAPIYELCCRMYMWEAKCVVMSCDFGIVWVMPSNLNATKVVYGPVIRWHLSKLQAIPSKRMEKRYFVAGSQWRNGNKPPKPYASDGFWFKDCISICIQLVDVLYQMLWFISSSFSLDFGDALHHILLAHNIYVLMGWFCRCVSRNEEVRVERTISCRFAALESWV